MTNIRQVHRFVGRNKPIGDVEAEALVLRAKGGDRLALDELTARYMRLIVKVASGFATPQMCIDDLVQDGAITLMLCIKLYSPGRSFGRYLTTALRNTFRKQVRADAVRLRGWVGSFDSDETELGEPVDEKAGTEAEELTAWRAPRVEAIEEMERTAEPRDAFLVRLASGAETGNKESSAMVAAVLGVSPRQAADEIRRSKGRCKHACERTSVPRRAAVRVEKRSGLRGCPDPCPGD